MTLTAIIAMLQAALTLLVQTAGTPLEPVAQDIARQAVVVAQAELQNMAVQPQQAQVVAQPQPEPVVSAPVTPKPMATLEIISPIPGKGLNRKYKAAPEVNGEENYVDLGLVVKDDQGNQVATTEVKITATDAEQNKTLTSTGNYTPTYGMFYPFHYEFKTPGTHTITFDALGQRAQVNLEVSE